MPVKWAFLSPKNKVPVLPFLGISVLGKGMLFLGETLQPEEKVLRIEAQTIICGIALPACMPVIPKKEVSRYEEKEF